jgi:hypothetical protein
MYGTMYRPSVPGSPPSESAGVSLGSRQRAGLLPRGVAYVDILTAKQCYFLKGT